MIALAWLLYVITVLLVLFAAVLVDVRRIKKRRLAAQARLDAIAQRADEQNNWILDGDLRGFYGDYPVPDLWPKKTMTEAGAATEAKPLKEPGIYETMKAQLDEIRRKGEAGTVIETWGGGIIRVLHDKYDYSDTLSVVEAQQQLHEARHQIEWAARRMGLDYKASGFPTTAYQMNAINALINAAKPAQVLHATPPRKPAKRKGLPALAEGGCVDELLKEAKEAHGA